MGRAPCCSKLGLNRGPWTAEEDALLAKHIEAHGEGCWKGLPKVAGLLRCGKSCRLRWVNYLRPSVKRGNISEDEEDLIIRMHSLLGNRWSLIAARIPGRTDNEIKNYWNTHLSKKMTRRGIDPKTHKPLQTAGPKYIAKVDHNIRQPLNILDKIHTEKAPSTENRNESSQSGLAFLGSHCDRRQETINTPTPIVSDNGDFARDASSIKSDVELSKNYGMDEFSLYGSPRRSNCSKEQKSFDSLINCDPFISVISSSSLENLQTVQPDRDNIQDYRHLDESVSISTASCSDSFAYLGQPPSSLVHNFSSNSSKCTSPSSDQSTTCSSHTAIPTVSCLKIMPPQLVEKDTNLSEYSTQFSVRELSSFEGENSTIILPISFEVDKDSNLTETVSDIEIPVFPAHARTLHNSEQLFCSEERIIEREIWNCVDKLATAEYLETVDQPFAESDFWNLSGCNGNYLDFHENLATFEWRHFDFLTSEDQEDGFSSYQA